MSTTQKCMNCARDVDLVFRRCPHCNHKMGDKTINDFTDEELLQQTEMWLSQMGKVHKSYVDHKSTSKKNVDFNELATETLKRHIKAHLSLLSFRGASNPEMKTAYFKYRKQYRRFYNRRSAFKFLVFVFFGLIVFSFFYCSMRKEYDPQAEESRLLDIKQETTQLLEAGNTDAALAKAEKFSWNQHPVFFPDKVIKYHFQRASLKKSIKQKENKP